MTAAIGDVLNRLEGVKQAGRGKWKALCPAHDDRNPSLSITEGDGGKVLLHCHAGCAYPDILTAAGLSVNGNGANSAAATSAKPKPPKPAVERRIVATYDYHDAAGQVIFQKVRYEPKDFRQRRPDGRGGWIWSLGDDAPVLYRLPGLIDPAAEWQPVYICEGEKDVDRLARLGLVATTNFDGAGKWRSEYNEYLAGRVVYILADNDEPGRAHGAAVANSTSNVAQAVKVVNLPGLPDRGDVSDWLDAGHTKEELERECLLSPIWEPTAAPSVNGNSPTVGNLSPSSIPLPMTSLVAHQFPPQQYLVYDLIAKGHLAVVAGRQKAGKSWLIIQLAMSIDMGVDFLGRETERAKILYYPLEDGDRRLQRRARAIGWQPENAAVLFSIPYLDDGQGGPGPGVEEIARYAQEYDLIIIDTLIAAMSGRTDERDNSSMGAILNALASIAHYSDTAIVLVHHTGKASNPDDIFSTLRGASAIRGAYDVGLILERRPDEKEGILHAESRDLDIRNMTLRQAENGAGWEYVGDAYEIEKVRAGRKVLETMLEHDGGDGMTAKQLAEVRKVSEANIYKQLTRLEKAGYVYRDDQPTTGMGRRPDIWRVVEGYR